MISMHPLETFTLGDAVNTFWVDRWKWSGVDWEHDWSGYEYSSHAMPLWDFYVWPGSYLAKHVWILKMPGWSDLGWQYNFDA